MDDRLGRGSAAFRRTNLALFAAGFSTFALLYCVQPLMPALSDHFAVGPAAASLALSASTLLLAVAMLAASSASEAWGRKPVMVASLLVAAALTLAGAFAEDWRHLLVLRALTGIAISGLPATAMAYIGEEMQPRALGLAMGLYIAGSSLGGMGGRLAGGVLADLLSWRMALAAIGAAGLGAGLLIWALLPASRHFTRRRLKPRALAGVFAAQLRDPGLRRLFLAAFLLMGGFVATYNYVGYRLMAPPFGLGQAEVGLVFAVYLAGVVGSAVMGGLSDRLGRAAVLRAGILLMLAGLALTAAPSVPAIIGGLAILTFGFFAAHSVAATWVGVLAAGGRGQASALYLCAYYLGSSLLGSTIGLGWEGWGWTGVVLPVAALTLAALVFARPRAAEGPG